MTRRDDEYPDLDPKMLALLRSPTVTVQGELRIFDSIAAGTPARCMKFAGGTPGCPTYCTLELGHHGDCSWTPGAQIAWNEASSAQS